MTFFGILRIKLNFSFPLFHFPVLLYEKKLVISPAAKPEVEENIAVSISVFFMAFHWSETSETQIIIDIQKQLLNLLFAALCLQHSSWHNRVE